MDETKAGGLIGAVRQKLIAAKEKWAREGRLLTHKPGTGRLPPGQRLVEHWPVLDLGVRPHVDLGTWQLTIDGLVENPVCWSWDDFNALPRSESVSDIHCVTAWSRYDNRWTGLSAQDLLAAVRPTAEAKYLMFHSLDGYTTNVSLRMFDAPGVLLAHSWEGAPLTPEHGAPVRVVMPQWYFWKSAKWLCRIEVRARDKRGFWEARGYHDRGDPWREQRYRF